jgi:hypothetical protein
MIQLNVSTIRVAKIDISTIRIALRRGITHGSGGAHNHWFRCAGRGWS